MTECPHCGEKERLSVWSPPGTALRCVRCEVCGASGPLRTTEERAVQFWNYRKDQEERDDARISLASATDLANTRAREHGCREARDESEIKVPIDELGDKVSTLRTRLAQTDALAEAVLGHITENKFCDWCPGSESCISDCEDLALCRAHAAYRSSV